jgi:hypothetical protein
MYQMDCKLVPYGEEERRCVKCGYITWNNEKTDKEIIDDMIAAGYPVPNCRENTTKCECGANTSCQCGPEEPKQETLEEVAKERLINHNLPIDEDFGEGYIAGAILGAKWQQEQDKNKFSEEDMINRTQVVFELTNKGYSIDEIIEQFKKK